MDQESPYSVALVPHAPYALAQGGMEIQQDKTIDAFERIGVRARLMSAWDRQVDADLIHVFGCEYAHYEYVVRAKKLGIPVVVTPMFMPQRPLWFFELTKHMGRFLPPTAHSIRQACILGADHLICINSSEARGLKRAFGADLKKTSIIPNGIEERFFHATSQAFVNQYGLKDFVLCVGMIEPRKNQLRLARVLRKLGVRGVFIGPVPPYGGSTIDNYASEFRGVINASENLVWLSDGLKHHDPLLESAFAAASVHVLPSSIEAQGLVTLEAYAAGCRVIVGDLPNLRELFTSEVRFASLTDDKDLELAVTQELSKPRREDTQANRPPWLISWDDVAQRIDAVYRKVLFSSK